MRTKNLKLCKICGGSLLHRRPDTETCSGTCYNKLRKMRGKITERTCSFCEKVFPVVDRTDANRRYCSRSCAKKSYHKKVANWRQLNKKAHVEYNQNRLEKNPNAWRDKVKRERAEALSLLGGKCIVCGVDKPCWLHVDFIPTQRGSLHRHPRHIGFIRKHTKMFRILCANHHYELTLTGQIEGTTIKQRVNGNKNTHTKSG